MKAATVRELKKELSTYSQDDLMKICLRLSKFKKENKELLTYLLYEAENEEGYLDSIKAKMDTEFEQVNRRSYYLIKKMVRKILREAKKYIRYSQKKDSEVEILLHFCKRLKAFKPSIHRDATLENIYLRQLASIEKKISKLHEDLQYDYEEEIRELKKT